ncbi:hypothetical protein GJ496_004586 [Pomphorhynchus laevis]|nr:hypothetical protein GJ496_004586 [Pomphorhynchus laevis]
MPDCDTLQNALISYYTALDTSNLNDITKQLSGQLPYQLSVQLVYESLMLGSCGILYVNCKIPIMDRLFKIMDSLNWNANINTVAKDIVDEFLPLYNHTFANRTNSLFSEGFVVNTFEKIISGLLKCTRSLNTQNQTIEEELLYLTPGIVIFALVWSFGASLPHDCRLEFDAFLRNIMTDSSKRRTKYGSATTENIPEKRSLSINFLPNFTFFPNEHTVFDYEFTGMLAVTSKRETYFDEETRTVSIRFGDPTFMHGYWTLWEKLGTTIIPTLYPSINYTDVTYSRKIDRKIQTFLKLLYASDSNVMLLGNRDLMIRDCVHKTLGSIEKTLMNERKLAWKFYKSKPQMNSSELIDAIELYQAETRNKNLIIIDDFCMHGKQSVADSCITCVRALMSANRLYSCLSKDRKFPSLPSDTNFWIISNSMNPHSGWSNYALQRRLLNCCCLIEIDDYSVDDLEVYADNFNQFLRQQQFQSNISEMYSKIIRMLPSISKRADNLNKFHAGIPYSIIHRLQFVEQKTVDPSIISKVFYQELLWELGSRVNANYDDMVSEENPLTCFYSRLSNSFTAFSVDRSCDIMRSTYNNYCLSNLNMNFICNDDNFYISLHRLVTSMATPGLNIFISAPINVLSSLMLVEFAAEFSNRRSNLIFLDRLLMHNVNIQTIFKDVVDTILNNSQEILLVVFASQHSENEILDAFDFCLNGQNFNQLIDENLMMRSARTMRNLEIVRKNGKDEHVSQFDILASYLRLSETMIRLIFVNDASDIFLMNEYFIGFSRNFTMINFSHWNEMFLSIVEPTIYENLERLEFAEDTSELICNFAIEVVTSLFSQLRSKEIPFESWLIDSLSSIIQSFEEHSIKGITDEVTIILNKISTFYEEFTHFQNTSKNNQIDNDPVSWLLDRLHELRSTYEFPEMYSNTVAHCLIKHFFGTMQYTNRNELMEKWTRYLKKPYNFLSPCNVDSDCIIRSTHFQQNLQLLRDCTCPLIIDPHQIALNWLSKMEFGRTIPWSLKRIPDIKSYSLNSVIIRVDNTRELVEYWRWLRRCNVLKSISVITVVIGSACQIDLSISANFDIIDFTIDDNDVKETLTNGIVDIFTTDREHEFKYINYNECRNLSQSTIWENSLLSFIDEFDIIKSAVWFKPLKIMYDQCKHEMEIMQNEKIKILQYLKSFAANLRNVNLLLISLSQATLLSSDVNIDWGEIFSYFSPENSTIQAGDSSILAITNSFLSYLKSQVFPNLNTRALKLIRSLIVMNCIKLNTENDLPENTVEVVRCYENRELVTNFDSIIEHGRFKGTFIEFVNSEKYLGVINSDTFKFFDLETELSFLFNDDESINFQTSMTNHISTPVECIQILLNDDKIISQMTDKHLDTSAEIIWVSLIARIGILYALTYSLTYNRGSLTNEDFMGILRRIESATIDENLHLTVVEHVKGCVMKFRFNKKDQQQVDYLLKKILPFRINDDHVSGIVRKSFQTLQSLKDITSWKTCLNKLLREKAFCHLRVKFLYVEEENLEIYKNVY